MNINTEDKTKSAGDIVYDFAMICDMCDVRESLTIMFHDWIVSEDEYSQETRAQVLSHYLELTAFTKNAEHYYKRKISERKKQTNH